MRDLFYTILVVWIVWRIYVSFSKHKSNNQKTTSYNSNRDGKTTIDNIPPNKKKGDFKGGEYVDYEEIK